MCDKIIQDIKKKKTLKNLDDEIVLQYVRKYSDNLNLDKKKDYEKLIKSVRAELHTKYGMFWLDDKFTLESHKSSKDRIKIYPILYQEIFKITGKPKSILDLACGLNPLSYKYLGCKPEYIASELSIKDCENIQAYFDKNKIDGKTIPLDLTQDNEYPNVDVTFLFAAFDTVEENGHKLAEKIIKSLKSKYVVVSFSTKTISNRKMNYPQRGWIERMLKRIEKSYVKLSYPNEIFYVIKS